MIRSPAASTQSLLPRFATHFSSAASLPRNRPRSNIVSVIAKRSTLVRLPCGLSANNTRLNSQLTPAQSGSFYEQPRTGAGPARTGGRGRIRTSVARKERQIYSLLVLATHPPVLENSSASLTACAQNLDAHTGNAPRESTKRTRVKRHQPVDFDTEDSLRSLPQQDDWWSWRRELNPRPSDYKSDALPAELRQRSQTNEG
jgi:hypothetical protein